MSVPVLETPPGPITTIDSREYLYFVGTGYLGLQGHPEVIRAACEATQLYGIHSATTRAGFGNTPPTLLAERRAAEFFGAETAFYFASGYAGNSILLPALTDNLDVVFVDELSHYCVIEAAQQSGRPVFRFRHRDAGDLAASLRKNLQPGQRPLVMSDGVFAARGTIAPVAEYRDALGGYAGAALLLDDAHAVGILGACGRETYEHAGFSDVYINADQPLAASQTRGARFFLCGTMSKAVGGFGGIIPGSWQFIERVKQSSHWYDGASAPPAAAAAATARAIELLMADPGLRTRLWSNVRLLKDGLGRMGFDVDDTPVPSSA